MDDPSSGTSDGTGSPTGVDAENVSVWFAENIPGVVPPLTFVRIPGGRSNLTFEVTDRAVTNTYSAAPRQGTFCRRPTT